MNTVPKLLKTVGQTALAILLFGYVAISLNSCAVTVQGETDDMAVYQNYVPPSWAPPYDNVSAVRYYYFPDYQMYFDVWGDQFWYLDPNGAWVASGGLPPQYAGIDLDQSFIVLIDRDVSTPWRNHQYYADNYPAHAYENYKDIVVKNRIVTNVAPNHELVPRAFNENTNRVTFMQHQIEAPHNSDARPATPSPHPGEPVQRAPAPVPPNNGQRASYNNVVHEVPMKAITPSMPAKSRQFNYGGGYTKKSAPAPKAPSASPQQNTRPNSGSR